MKILCTVVFMLLFAQTPSLFSAPGNHTTEDEKDFVVGLALSGGGAAGLAHIGVLKVMEEAGVPIDVVSGTSMGAIVGGLYAIGYTPQLMLEEVSSADWRFLFEETVYRSHLPMEEKKYDGLFKLSFPVNSRRVELPTGLVSGNHIINMLALLTWPYHETDDFRQLPRPFVCIATDLETGDAVVLDNGFLPDAIRASMSIPTIFDPVWVNGRYLVDGGVVNNLPVREAYDLGADYVIAINSSPDLKPAGELLSLPDILTQTIAVGMQTSMMLQSENADFYIRPDLHAFSSHSFSDVNEIIKAGEQAARTRFDELKALADSLKQLRRIPDKPDIPVFEPAQRLNIRNLYFKGLETVPEDHIRSILQIGEHSTISEHDLNEGLLRLYGMQRFDKVTYRLSWTDDLADLTIFLEEQTANIIQFGFHHNNVPGLSLLFNATFRNLIYPASTARFNLRVGHETLVEGQYFNYVGLEPRLSFYGSAGFRERRIDIFDGRNRLTNLKTDILHSEALIGPLYASVARIGIGYRFEYFNLTDSYGDLDVSMDWTQLHLLSGEFEFDNLNRSHLPTSGHYTLLRTDFSPNFFPNEATFGRISVKWDTYYPLSDRISLIQSLQGGHVFRGDPPLHYRFYAGGHRSFWGYPADAISGNTLLTASTAVQYRFYDNFYITPGINAGDSFSRLDTDILETLPRWGWVAILGWNTVIGPIETVLSGSRAHPLLFEFQIGLNF
ncbi:MAG: patatin-like phospholipase family protein [Balneolales bacterium]